MNNLLLTLANMGVNLDDVADVVNNCIPQLIFFGVVVAAAIIVLIAMAVNKKLAKPTKFMVRAQSGLAVLLAFGIMLNLVAFGPMSTMLDLVTVHFYTENGDFSASGLLKNFEEKLAGRPFARCNNCYLVNLAQVAGIAQEIVKVGPHSLPVSRTKRRAFLDAMSDYIDSASAV